MKAGIFGFMLLLIWSGSAAEASAAGSAVDECVQEALADVQAAARALDTGLLESIELPPACVEQTSTWQVRYFRGLVSYRLAEIRMAVDDENADEGLIDAIEQLDTALENNPECAKCHAMLSSAYGMRIALRPIRGITLGRRVDRHISAAVELDAEHPVVLLLRANRRLYSPGRFGGDLDKAEKLFGQALERFSHLPPQAGWDLADVHYHAAIHASRKEDRQAVCHHLEAALASSPGFVLASQRLEQY